MIVKPCGEYVPRLHPTVRAGENVTLVGQVSAEEDVSFWYGAVARGDCSSISIGAGSNIQDNCVLHNSSGVPLTLGKGVTVGHGAILHSCQVGDNCLIGMGSILLTGCVIGEGSTVAAGALVTERQVIPPNSLVMGVPARVVRQLTPEDHQGIAAMSAHYVAMAKEQLPLVDIENFQTKPE